MSYTTRTQPTSTSEEEWLENIRCPTFFDFEAAVSYPCTLGDDNPPLRESVYDSDDETRAFFCSLNKNPSLHPTLHRRSLSPHRNRLQNAGKPLYRHRPKTSFADYLAEFQNREAHQANKTIQNAAALSSESESSPARNLTPQSNISTPDLTPSPQDAVRDIHSDAWATQVPKTAKVVPLRRPRRSLTSSHMRIERVDPKVNQEQSRFQAQNPARRKPRPPERNIPKASGSRIVRNDRRVKSMVAPPKEATKPDFDGNISGICSDINSVSIEIDGRNLKLSPTTQSDISNSPTDLEIRATENDACAVDRDFVKIMEEHNERLRKSKSGRAGSSISARTESEKAFRSKSLKDAASVAPALDSVRVTDSEKGADRTERTSLTDGGGPGSALEIVNNPEVQSKNPSDLRRISLSQLLKMENEKVLEERKRRLPERRKALQQHRMNALRNFGVSTTEGRLIKPISTHIEFTSAETRKTIRGENNVKGINNDRRAKEQNQFVGTQNERNKERGLRGYRSRKGGNQATKLSGAFNTARNRQTGGTTGKAELPGVPTQNLQSRMDLFDSNSGDSNIQRDEVPPQTLALKKEVSDDLKLLLTEHNNRIRRNRAPVGTINN
ncbi:unnamed protein product [Agarophyton chilense]